LAAAKLCDYVNASIDGDTIFRYNSKEAEDNDLGMHPFSLTTLADLMQTVKALSEKEISIRASDNEHSWAFYMEREHTWGVGYKSYTEAVRYAVMALMGEKDDI